MIAAAGATYSDPVPSGHRVKLMINVTPGQVSIPGVKGLVSQGTHEIVIHHELVSKVLDLVEDQKDTLPVCQRIVDQQVRSYVQAKMGDEFRVFGSPFNEAIKDWPPQEQWPAALQKIAEEHECSIDGTSVAREFYRMHGRSRKPLSGAKILEDNLPAETSEEARRTADVINLMQVQSAPTLSEAMAVIEDLRAKVDRLESAQKPAPKKA